MNEQTPSPTVALAQLLGLVRLIAARDDIPGPVMNLLVGPRRHWRVTEAEDALQKAFAQAQADMRCQLEENRDAADAKYAAAFPEGDRP